MIPTTRSARPAISYNALAADVYPARIVRFVGLGVQDQPEFQGQKKEPAFKCAIQFELIGVDATGTKADGTPIDPRPACVFQDYFLFPGASRGKVFDMCKVIDPSIDATPRSLDWFIEHLNSIVMVQVGTYQTRDGVTKNKVVSVQPVPGFIRSTVGEARSDIVGFNPYVDNEEALSAYNKLFQFQRTILEQAHDRAYIPLAGKEPEAPQLSMTFAPKEQAAPSPTPKAPEMPVEGVEGFDDDMPF